MILVVEDDKVDQLTIKRAFTQLELQKSLVIRDDGVEAVEFLNKQQDMPVLIIMDLNMPRMNGLELLLHIKTTPRLKDIPVVVMTTSEEENDINSAYKGGVFDYIVKPRKHDQWVNKISDVLERLEVGHKRV